MSYLRAATPSSRSSRKDRRKRTYDDYVSDDSSLADIGSDSETEYTVSSSSLKRFRSSGTMKVIAEELAKEADNGDDEISRKSLARDGCEERLLMRQWLQRQADVGSIPGLHWVDSDRTKIRIPWKHGSRTGWTIEDCRVYRAWAIHTGKINCVTEPKKWKANFRCALNSLPDVREVPHLCQKKGSDPFKVYQMLPEVPRKSMSKKRKRCKQEKCEHEPESVLGILPPIKIKEEEEGEQTSCSEETQMNLGSYYVPLGSRQRPDHENEDAATSAAFGHDESTVTHIPTLIPTVVEEISEDFKIDGSILTPLRSSEFSKLQTVTPSPSSLSAATSTSLLTPSFSPSADSAYASDSNGEAPVDDFNEIGDLAFLSDLIPDCKLDLFLEPYYGCSSIWLEPQEILSEFEIDLFSKHINDVNF